jgi:hypothetical protein
MVLLHPSCIEICGHQAPAGWNFSIQTYNILPSKSLIFELAGIGNVARIQDLFKNGEASPFDRDENGLTVLDVRLPVVMVYVPKRRILIK